MRAMGAGLQGHGRVGGTKDKQETSEKEGCNLASKRVAETHDELLLFLTSISKKNKKMTKQGALLSQLDVVAAERKYICRHILRQYPSHLGSSLHEGSNTHAETKTCVCLCLCVCVCAAKLRIVLPFPLC